MNGHHLKLLKELSKDNKLSQRELSKKLGLSLGSVNFVLSNLIDAGLIKAKRFKNSKNKIAYMYIMTPAGIKSRMQLSRDFLTRKLDEYEMIKLEIEELRRESWPQEKQKIEPNFEADPFLQVDEWAPLTPEDTPGDLAHQHDHFLYGTEKK